MSPRVTTFPIGPLETNCYLLDNGGRAVAVDPGGEPGPLTSFLDREKLALDAVLITHLHFDHIYGASALTSRTGTKAYAPPGDEYLMRTELGRGGFMGLPQVDEFDYEPIEEGEYEFAGLPCHVLSTPGHTTGSVSFHFPDAGCVFVGDLLFYRSIGRVDFPGGDLETLKDSVRRKIFTLPDETTVYAGHMIETTVGDEKNHNPYFQE
ncbi:MBL fold metallo-hydrolase [Desulfohalovibrio reitneri]|uniref:MBL fold metallo-hydrolase n=1 Tax=Desulfohalovibrio reitneri TaxID=1307759 RepID=UPI0004A6E2CA|nr:MBL fold metallo-hydrolase [Desulfohalovibrio reitneri]